MDSPVRSVTKDPRPNCQLTWPSPSVSSATASRRQDPTETQDPADSPDPQDSQDRTEMPASPVTLEALEMVDSQASPASLDAPARPDPLETSAPDKPDSQDPTEPVAPEELQAAQASPDRTATPEAQATRADAATTDLPDSQASLASPERPALVETPDPMARAPTARSQDWRTATRGRSAEEERTAETTDRDQRLPKGLFAVEWAVGRLLQAASPLLLCSPSLSHSPRRPLSF